MAERLRIALLIDSSRSYRRGLLRGIAAYARAYGPWSFCHHEAVLGDSLPPQLRDWGGDGIIARTHNPKLIEDLQRLNLPMVGKFGSQERPRHAGDRQRPASRGPTGGRSPAGEGFPILRLLRVR